jgi:hypothetical protein
MSLKPFWRYYGGKYRAAPGYAAPEYRTVIEPFAGAAGYSLRYPGRDVILVDRSPIIAGIWRYLIGASASDVLAIPDIPDGGTVDDLPVCQEARWLAGFWCNDGTVHPCKTASAWNRAHAASGKSTAGWGHGARARIARQVDQIRHWRIIEGDYHDAPDLRATWFVDPPYSTPAGRYYKEQPASFSDLGAWCRTRQGQVMVCEQQGADWLPFRPHETIRATVGKARAGVCHEVIWTSGHDQTRLFDAETTRATLLEGL